MSDTEQLHCWDCGHYFDREDLFIDWVSEVGTEYICKECAGIKYED